MDASLDTETLRLFLDQAPTALAMFDREMRYLAVSQRWLDDYGLAGRNLVGHSHYEIFPEIPGTWKEVHRRGLAGEVVRADADRFQRQDGSIQYLRWEVHPWRRPEGDVGGILTLSRCTRGQLNRDLVDVSTLCSALIKELDQVEPGREVVAEIEPGLQARGDARMIEVLLRNLLGNAWKYSSHRSEARIRVYPEDSGGQHWICIADNGAGFDMAYAGHLFQPFQRLHRQDEFPGMGIGLATARRIVDRHGGRIQAQAEPGAGATFMFTLPEQP